MNDELVKAGYLAFERGSNCIYEGNVLLAVYIFAVGVLLGFFASLFVDLRSKR